MIYCGNRIEFTNAKSIWIPGREKRNWHGRDKKTKCREKRKKKEEKQK